MSSTSASFAEILQRNHRVTGNTYPVKDQLKQLGCVWGKQEKRWFAPDKETQAKAQEIVGGKIYNSPPPADLTGDESAAELAAKFNRTAVEGATVKTFSVYGLARGDNGDDNGTLHKIKGVRYLQVARSRRRYLSRDMLEDFDMFDCQPGGSYDWQGVEVKPTEAEIAEDKKRQAAKDEADRKKREAAEAKQREADERKRVWEAAIEGLECCTTSPAEYESTKERLAIGEKSHATKILLPDGQAGWEHNVSLGYDDHRTYWYLPSEAATAARIAWAESVGITPEAAAEWLKKYAGCHGADIYWAVAEADEATKQKLRDAAGELKRAKEQEQRDRQRAIAARQAAKPAVAKACAVEDSAVTVDYGSPPETATVKYDTKEAAASAPSTVVVSSDADEFDQYVVSIDAEAPPETILVRCALGSRKGQSNYQTYRVHLERQEFVAAWPVNEDPDTAESIERPSGLSGDEAKAYRAARKKAGKGAIAPFGIDQVEGGAE